MKKVLMALSFLLLMNHADSQVTQECAARYNGPVNNHDYGYSVAVDGSGNTYVTGFSNTTGAGTGNDYATIKYNSSGVQQWVTKYNGPGNSSDYAYDIAVDLSGNSYVTGISIGVSGNYQCATIKYNASGVEQWAARYSSTTNGLGSGYKIKVDNSGNVYVAGESPGNGTSTDFTTIKYNSSGSELWVARYNGPENSSDVARSLAIDLSGNVYLTGESNGSDFFSKYATVKYNSSGIEQWSKRYDGPGSGNDLASSIAVDPSGYVCVTGSIASTATNYDYATVCYSPSGVEQWVRTYDGPSGTFDQGNSIAADIDGNVFVTGQSKRGTGAGVFNYATIKYNSSGIQQWVMRYDGSGNGDDIARSMVLDGLGNVYVTGNSRGVVGFDDYVTIKYNSSGVQQWEARYDGPGNNTEECRSIVLDGAGNVYITGFSYGGSGTLYDYATIKYSQTVGIHQISSEISQQFNLIQNYPNPFNPVTKLEFSIPDLGFVSLKIYNMLGNEIATLVNEKLSAGSFSVEWNTSDYPSGTYFYKLETEKFSAVKKMMLVK